MSTVASGDIVPINQPYAYTGGEYDRETGGTMCPPFTGPGAEMRHAPLARYKGGHAPRARYYMPEIGRFIQMDPIKFRSGDANFYAYTGSSPIGAIDPWGLRPLSYLEKFYLIPYIPYRDLTNADVHIGEMPWYAPDWAAGITRGNDIYIRDPNEDFSTSEGMSLLGHELVHVGQYAEGMTWLSYLWASQNGYEKNPYEIEAYKIGMDIYNDLKAEYGEHLLCSE